MTISTTAFPTHTSQLTQHANASTINGKHNENRTRSAAAAAWISEGSPLNNIEPEKQQRGIVNRIITSSSNLKNDILSARDLTTRSVDCKLESRMVCLPTFVSSVPTVVFGGTLSLPKALSRHYGSSGYD